MPNSLTINNRDGTVGQPAVLRSDGGAVIIDCTLDYASAGLWTAHGNNNVYKATLTSDHIDATTPASSQVFVNDVRYTYIADTTYTTLAAGTWAYDGTAHLIYAHVTGNGNPGSQATYISDKQRADGIRVRNTDYLTIDGLIVRRSVAKGIDVTGASTARLNTVTIKNSTVKENFKQGIYYKWTTNGLITSNYTHNNQSHGIHLVASNAANVSRNASYYNDDPSPPRNGITGIRIGDTKDSTEVEDIDIDYNILHHNEDSGLEVHSARRVRIRRNVSYQNRDHGYDHNYANRVALINNVAFRNDHDGISVEDSTQDVLVYNNILVHNAVDPSTLAGGSGNVRELFVDNSTGFVSNNNVFVALTTGTIANGERHLVEYDIGGSKTEYDALSAYQSGTGQDALSYSTMPIFTTDTTSGVFTITSASDNVVDAAKTTNIAGWTSAMHLTVDPRGFNPHDTTQPDVESVGTTYMDIGAYEVDPLPGPPTMYVFEGLEDFVVLWDERGDDGDDMTAATHEVWINSSGTTAVTAASPGTPICVHYSWNSCSPIAVQLKVTDGNGQVAWSNLKNTSTDCSGTQGYECNEDGVMVSGDEESSTFSFEDGRVDPSFDYPLSLQVLGQNPTRALTGILCGIPKAMVGKPYELAMFDVSGRRVWASDNVVAKPGRFVEQLSKRPGDSGTLSAGVYFLRLRIADKVLTRSVLLVP